MKWIYSLLMVLTWYVAAAENNSCDRPRVSVITSLFNADAYLPHFILDILRQTIFDQCEFIFINANSPGNEEAILKPYIERYPNIVYLKLEQDPGLFGVWNIGAKRARADFITNANVDDFFAVDFLEFHEKMLREDRSVDVVFSSFTITYDPYQFFENHSYSEIVHEALFDLKPWIFIETPNNHTMWRKSIHARYGYFDESFKTVGDVEFYTRLITRGVKFKKSCVPRGAFYINPNGLSQAWYNKTLVQHELNIWRERYAHINNSYRIPCG